MDLIDLTFKIGFGFFGLITYSLSFYFIIKFYRNLNLDENFVLMQFYLDKELHRSLKILSFTAILFSMGSVFDLLYLVTGFSLGDYLSKVLFSCLFFGFLNFSIALFQASRKR